MGTQFLDVYGTPQTFTAFTWTAQGAGTLTEVFEGTHLMNALSLICDITASSGTPTVNIYIQKELPGGEYTDIGHLTAQTGVSKRYGDIVSQASVAAEAAVQDAALAAGTMNPRIFGESIRVKVVIGGTTPSVTGTVKITFYRFPR